VSFEGNRMDILMYSLKHFNNKLQNIELVCSSETNGLDVVIPYCEEIEEHYKFFNVVTLCCEPDKYDVILINDKKH